MEATARFESVLAALADPTRRAILDRLAQGPARVTDVAAPFAISLPAISRHVRLLEESGLVRRARHGREHILQLDAEPLHALHRWASQYERYWNSKLDRLEQFFTAHPENTP